MTNPPVCLVNSLPKSGTHLLKKLVCMFPGMYPVDFHIGPRQFGLEMHASAPDAADQSLIPVGVGRPRRVARETVAQALRCLRPGSLGTAHAPYSDGLATLFEELGIRAVLIVRDPRDVAVSHAHYIYSLPPGDALRGKPLHQYYQTLTETDRIMTSIVGVRREPDGPVLLNIHDRLASVLPWNAAPANYTTRFERLVGARGGGTDDAQRAEIGQIARHLGFDLAEAQIHQLAAGLFGGTATFRRGMIGGWRDQFNPDHKRACKDLLGQLLVDLGYEHDLDW